MRSVQEQPYTSRSSREAEHIFEGDPLLVIGNDAPNSVPEADLSSTKQPTNARAIAD